MFAPLSSAILSLSTSAARAFDAGMAAALAAIPTVAEWDATPAFAFADATGADVADAMNIVAALRRGERMTGADVLAAVEAYAVETEALRLAAAARRIAEREAFRAASPLAAPSPLTAAMVYPPRPCLNGGNYVGD